MNRPKIAEFQDVSKRYRSLLPGRAVQALDGVSFAVEQGESFGVVGPNRAGKSTLVKLLLSLCRPTAGSITRFGRPSHERRTLARIGYIHESQALPRYWHAEGLLHYYGAMSDLPGRVVRRRAAELLDRVGLADRRREPIGRFSKGMLQRLALAQALLNEPELLVFDEPTEGMDLLARRLVFEAIARQRERGRSVLLVSHSLADVERFCDRVAVLREGRLMFVGSVAELRGPGQPSTTQSLEEAVEPLYEQELACV